MIRSLALALILLASPALADVSVTDPPYLAACDGVTDDSVAIQAAVGAVQGQPGARLILPRRCAVSQPIYVTAALTVACPDATTSGLVLLSSVNGIVVRTDSAFRLIDCWIGPASEPTFGACVQLTGDVALTGINRATALRGNIFEGCYTGLDIVAAARCVVTGNLIERSIFVGISIRNTVNWDDGDCTFTENQILGSATATAGIWMRSGSGHRISNNKLQSGQYGLLVELNNFGEMNNLLVEGNSIEGHDVDAVRLTPVGGISFMRHFVFVGNEVHPNPGAVGLRIQPNLADVAWVDGAVITANSFMLDHTAVTGADLWGVKALGMGNNVFRSSTTIVVAVRIRASSVLGRVEHQTCVGTAACVANSSTSVIVEP